ncbi:N-myc-interactor [Bombina bombina]|uniref:N-myc-interactor n=1 Tax=Bombina bombina TaxID=8345 RepID=UPI00235A7038|nr:N-myc-interactor [Bombina bombina]
MENSRQLQEQYEMWLKKCDVEEKRKTQLLLKKLDAQEAKKEAETRVTDLMKKGEEVSEEKIEKEKLEEREVNDLHQIKAKLVENNQKLEEKLKAITEAYKRIKEEVLIENNLPKNNINFKETEALKDTNSPKDKDLDISCICFVVLNYPFVLKKGQALLTFEEEHVAQSIIKKKNHEISFSESSSKVTALPVHLCKTVKFEVNLNISSKKMLVENVPFEIPDEYIRDKLEVTFYKSDIGGGEIENVEYDRCNNRATITYLENGVVQNVIKRKEHQFNVNNCNYTVTVQPHISYSLNKLLVFSGISTRTVLLDNINHYEDSEEDIQDSIEIHFQKPSNGGGEVEHTAYNQQPNRVAYFEDDMNTK